jgi:ArsR family transcriptional regulator
MNYVAMILKALGDRNRIRILKLLKRRTMCVCELAAILGITQPSVSRHLKKLRAVGIVGDEQDGLWTNYYLNPAAGPHVKTLLSDIHSWLNDDPVIKSDLEKAVKVDRTKLCCKK